MEKSTLLADEELDAQFSTFTGNIVFLRSLRNLSMSSNRFW